MNKAKVFVIALLLLLIPSIGICESDGWTGNLNFYIGKNYLDSDDWEPVDEQLLLGVSLDFRPQKWPFNIAIGYFYSFDDETDPSLPSWFEDSEVIVKSSYMKELDIGVRKIWESSPIVRPYIGGGLAFINGRIRERELGSQNDDGKGFYINAGLYWTHRRGNIGFDFRYSKADITLFGEDLDAGGFSAAVIIGAHW